MARRRYSSTAVDTTLSSGITNSETSLTVVDDTGYPSVPFVIVIDPDTGSEELVLVNSRAGAIFSSVTRGYDGTSAVSHSAAAVVKHVASAADFDEVWTHTHATADGHAAVPFSNLSGTLAHTSLGSVSANQHHSQLHASAHKDGGGDDLGFDLQGLLSARPAAGTVGRLYFATDNDVLYRDDGSTWDAVDATKLLYPSKGSLVAGSGVNTIGTLGASNNGNVLTSDSGTSVGLSWQPPQKVIFIPAGVFSIGNGTPVLTNIAAGGVQGWKLDSTSDESIFTAVGIPDEWTEFDIFVWHVNDTASTGNIRFQLYYNIFQDNESISGGLVAVTTVIAAGAQDTLKRTAAGTVTAPVAGIKEMAFIEPFRDADHVDDTFATDWNLMAIELVGSN